MPTPRPLCIFLTLGLLAACADDPSTPDPPSWEDLPPLPFPVAALAATSDGEQIFVFGGEDRSGKETHTQIYNISSKTWTQGTPVPEAVSWAAAIALPDGIHLVGGVTNSTAATTAHRIYDPRTNEWSIGTALPVAMAGGTGQYVDEKLVVMGGIDGPSHHSDNVHVYDPNTTQWSSGTAVPGARINWTSEILNGLIFGAGGGTPGIATGAELLAYNPGTDSWQILANLLQRREAHGSGVSGGTFCVFGGRIAQGGNFNTPFASMECYSPDTNTWAASVPLPIARQALGSVSVNGYIYAVGGHDHIKRGTTYFTRIKF